MLATGKFWFGWCATIGSRSIKKSLGCPVLQADLFMCFGALDIVRLISIMHEISICPIWLMGAPYAYGAVWYAYGQPIQVYVFIWAVPYVYGQNKHVG